jgi:mannose/cellobiose epimerase-like protein (N-acyl-D-glucosamine 2-epimerase family)
MYRCLDHESGGFFQYFRDDGAVYEATTRHLVSTARFVFTYAISARLLSETDEERAEYTEGVKHGLKALRGQHYDTSRGAYAWVVAVGEKGGGVTTLDGTNHCYGLAFVLLAYAQAAMAGVGEALGWMHETFKLMERRFWSDEYGRYADEASADWSVLQPYRGQNANMHATEALLACFEACGERRYLERALCVARHVACGSTLGAQCGPRGGLIWEHYTEEWRPDLEYNRGDRTNLFRPWGFQVGIGARRHALDNLRVPPMASHSRQVINSRVHVQCMHLPACASTCEKDTSIVTPEESKAILRRDRRTSSGDWFTEPSPPPRSRATTSNGPSSS